MDRRDFLAAGIAAGATLSVGAGITSAQTQSNAAKFKLRYAPGFGSFRAHVGDDIIDNIKFAADQGFRAMFDNGLNGKPVELQEKIAAEIARHDMKLGPFVVYANFGDSNLMTNNKDAIESFLRQIEAGKEVVKRTHCEGMLVVPGRVDQRLEIDYQAANLIKILRRACEIVEKDNVMIVLEPLNRHDHPGQFLRHAPDVHDLHCLSTPAAKSSMTCTTSRSPKATSSPTSSLLGPDRRPTSVTTPAGEPDRRNQLQKHSGTSTGGFDVLCRARPQQGGRRRDRLHRAYRWADSFEA